MMGSLLLLLFATLLTGLIIKLNRFEAVLPGENERAIIRAQQKMDLLLYMSQEVRNPLTAIRDFFAYCWQKQLVFN
jgi:two-component system sensor histidine kinase BarA